MVLRVALLLLCTWFSYTDLRSRVIPNRITHPVLFALLLFRMIVSPQYLWGLVPAVFLLTIFMLKPGAVGAGDVKLVSIVGVVLGLERVILPLLVMCFAVLGYTGVRRLLRLSKFVSVPLAPFMWVGLVVELSSIS
ncbi:A24 family peptidase [Paenibacillus graminis]|nr:A24 family peptidase [Paenibacillus graminis]